MAAGHDPDCVAIKTQRGGFRANGLAALTYSVSEQHIAATSPVGAIARIDVQHSVRDRRARPDHRTAMRFHAIGGRKIPIGVRAPQQLSVARGISAKSAIG